MKGVSFNTDSGLAIAADVGGSPSAPPVVLLHGGGQTRHSWKQTFQKLVARGYYVISIDLRGHGESDWSADQDYTLDAFSNDLFSIVSKLSNKPALVGASLGGLASLLCQANSLQLARALILVDVAPQIETEGVEKIIKFMKANPAGFASVEAAFEATQKYNPNRQRSKSTSGILNNLRTGDDGRLYWHWDPSFLSGDHREKAKESSQRLLNAASKITIPTLLIRGQHSDVVSKAGVNELWEKIPHMDFIEIEGAGHMVAGDENNTFTSAILRFLDKHHRTEAAH